MISVIEQHILGGGKRKYYLNRGRMLNITIKRKKRFHAAAAPHVLVFDLIHCEKLMEMTYNDQIYFQIVQTHYLLMH